MSGVTDRLPPEGPQAEGDDAFEAMFNEIAGELVTAPPTDATDSAPDTQAPEEPPAPEAGGEQAPEAPSQDDIWANAPPAARAAFEAAQQRLRALEHADSSNRGRISHLQRQLNALQSGILPNAGAKPDKAEPAEDELDPKAVIDSPEYRQTTEEYPEVAGVFDRALRATLARQERQERELRTYTEERRQAFFDENERLMREAHPDYDQIAAGGPLNAMFAQWVQQQPPSVQQVVMAQADRITDPVEASEIIRRFKQDTGRIAPSAGATGTAPTTDARREAQLRGSRAGRLGGAGAPSGAPDDFEGAFEHFANRRSR